MEDLTVSNCLLIFNKSIQPILTKLLYYFLNNNIKNNENDNNNNNNNKLHYVAFDKTEKYVCLKKLFVLLSS